MKPIVNRPPMSPQELAETYDLPLKTAKAAWKNVHCKTAVLMVISGKIAAGKDTVAPMVMKLLNIPENQHSSDFFARALKEEVNVIIGLINEHKTKGASVVAIREQMKVTKKFAEGIYDILAAQVKEQPESSAYLKTPAIRSSMQYWGTQVRRSQDDNYWVKKTLQSVLKQLAEGKSVQITDARFPNELDSALGAGAYAVRLNVSPEVQRKRVKSRDGMEMSEKVRLDLSETALDEYGNFDVYLDTDDKSPNTLAQTIVESLEKKQHDRT